MAEPFSFLCIPNTFRKMAVLRLETKRPGRFYELSLFGYMLIIDKNLLKKSFHVCFLPNANLAIPSFSLSLSLALLLNFFFSHHFCLISLFSSLKF